MKAFLILLFVIIIGVFGWFFVTTYASGKPSLNTTTITDTMLIVRDSIINARAYESTPTGFYQGMLPCKNCEGIQRTIMFSGNQFKMEELNWGNGTIAKKTFGTWEKVKDKFILSVNSKAVSEYRLVKDSLINVENNGIRIPDSASKSYALIKKNTPGENLSWAKRRSEGIDVIGNGSDPFWSLEIDNEKFILFKLATFGKPIIVPVEKPVITKDSVFYSVTTEAGAVLKISIASKFCNDGVSDHLYEYKMTVWYKGEMYKGCAVIMNTPRED
ncbi:MAG: copper resistance protein NlpE N-terminal domain-containing protein [Chitinophagaceae bacterium]